MRSCRSRISARGAISSYTGGTASAAAVRAASVSESLKKVLERDAVMSVLATSPAARLTWPVPMLTLSTAKRASARKPPTMTARAHAPRPDDSVLASVRGMNIALAAQEAPHQVGDGLPVGASLGLGHDPAHHLAEIGRRRGAGLGD